MRKLKILIVDDEPPARKKLRAYLVDENKDLAVFEAENGTDAVEKIRAIQPNLVFLDIQMPGKNGFEVIETIGAENMPTVIFVTAYDQFALEAFEVQAIDYLLKPFDQGRFQKSFQRALNQIQQKSGNADILDRLLESIQKEKKYLDRIMVNKGAHFYFVKATDIIYISAEEKYVELHTKGDSHLVRDTMVNMEKNLDPQVFTRIHRSYIINLDYLKEMQPWSHGDYIVILKSGKELPLSRRYKDRLFGKT